MSALYWKQAARTGRILDTRLDNKILSPPRRVCTASRAVRNNGNNQQQKFFSRDLAVAIGDFEGSIDRKNSRKHS